MAPCSSASRDIVVKMVTPVSGSFERMFRVREARALFYELPRLEREYRVLVAERHDTIVIAVLGELPAQQTIAKLADFVAIQVVDILAHELRPRCRPRPDAVCLEACKHVATVAVVHPGSQIGRASCRERV